MKGLLSRCNRKVAVSVFMLVMSVLPTFALAATLGVDGGAGGTEFQAFYDFIFGAATGFLGRSVAIIGGLVGLGMGAFSGRIMVALAGVALAVFGVLGPTIINALFTSAII